MRVSFPLKLIIISGILLISGLLIWALTTHENEADTTQQTNMMEPDYPLYMKGIIYNVYDSKGALLSRIKADELKVNPRRFFIFNIRKVNEITITNVLLDLYLNKDTDTQGEMDIVTFSKSIVPQKGEKGGRAVSKEVGWITRGVIKGGLTINVFKDGRPVMVIKANSGVIDFKRNIIKLNRGYLEDLQKKRVIQSSMIIWDNKEKVFKIPGGYTATSPKGRAEASGLKVDLNFNLSRLDKEK